MRSIWLIDHQDIYDVGTLERISIKSQISWPVKSSSWRISRPPYWRYAGKNAAAHLFPPQIFIRELSGNSWWHEVKWSEIGKPDTKKRATIFSRNSFIIKMVVGDGFEPSKDVLADLQSAPFGHSGIPPVFGAGNGGRTRITSLEGWCTAVMPYPHTVDTAVLPYRKKMVPSEGVEPSLRWKN